MNDPNLVASPEDVFALLAADGVPHRVDAEHGQVLIPTRLGSEDAVLTLRWASADGLLQLFQDMGEVVAQPQIAAVEEAITRLNHAMPVPGFGLNPEQGRLYYRLTVPLRQGTTACRRARRARSPSTRSTCTSRPVTALRALFSAAVKNASDFLPVLRSVSRGEIAPAEVLTQAAALIASRDPSVPTA